LKSEKIVEQNGRIVLPKSVRFTHRRPPMDGMEAEVDALLFPPNGRRGRAVENKKKIEREKERNKRNFNKIFKSPQLAIET